MARCLESSLVGKGIGRERTIYILQHQRLIGGLDPQLHITPGAPPKRGEATFLSPIGNQLIRIADKLFICNLITVSLAIEVIGFHGLLGITLIQCLRIGDAQLSRLTATESHGEVTRCQGVIIQQQSSLRMRWDRQCLTHRWEPFRTLYPFGGSYLR